uniref:Uncharacterized protein n=2 Tax=Anguilla anguilla TaxID=7936 RepID=A0A0E9XPZ9_ANGAN
MRAARRIPYYLFRHWQTTAFATFVYIQ